MPLDTGPQSFKDIFSKKNQIKPPAYQWQELALRVIDELAVPSHKRNSVFRVCKQYSRAVIEKCLTDTKELSQGDDRWRYFFKVIANLKTKKPAA